MLMFIAELAVQAGKEQEFETKMRSVVPRCARSLGITSTSCTACRIIRVSSCIMKVIQTKPPWKLIANICANRGLSCVPYWTAQQRRTGANHLSCESDAHCVRLNSAQRSSYHPSVVVSTDGTIPALPP